MKPPELTVYPPLSPFVRAGVDNNIEQGRYPYLGFNAEMHVPGVVLMHTKRLTEAELSAEFWAAENEAKGLIIDGYYPHPAQREAEILLRFATTPHYFEEAA